MEKRSFSLVVSPSKAALTESNKKLKVSTSPKKLNENNLNFFNFQQELHDELDGLCFEDDDDEFLLPVSNTKELEKFNIYDSYFS